MIFVNILDVCVKMLKFRYSSHFFDLFFFGNLTITLLLKSSGNFPVVYTLLIRQYKVCLISPLTVCSNSAGMLYIYSVCFFISFHLIFYKFCLCYCLTQFFRVVSSILYNSPSSSLPLYNSSMFCCHLSAIYSFPVRDLINLIQ